MQKAEEARINMLSLQESQAMYFLDGWQYIKLFWMKLNLPVDELTDAISKDCPCVYQQSDW